MKVIFIEEGSDLLTTHKTEQQLSQTKDVLFCRRKKPVYPSLLVLSWVY